jgi:hypothetical protein
VAAILFCAVAFLQSVHIARPMLLSPTPPAEKAPEAPSHISTAPLSVIRKEIGSAQHELDQAASRQADAVQIDAVQHDSFNKMQQDMREAARLAGSVATMQKKTTKKIDAVTAEIKQVEAQEAGLENSEHAMHKHEAAEIQLQNTIHEEEAAIADAERDHQAISTREGHLKGDMAAQAHLQATLRQQAAAFASSAHEYVHPQRLAVFLPDCLLNSQVRACSRSCAGRRRRI